MSATTAGSNDTIVNPIAQELVFGGKIKIRLFKVKNVNQNINGG